MKLVSEITNESISVSKSFLSKSGFKKSLVNFFKAQAEALLIIKNTTVIKDSEKVILKVDSRLSSYFDLMEESLEHIRQDNKDNNEEQIKVDHFLENELVVLANLFVEYQLESYGLYQTYVEHVFIYLDKINQHISKTVEEAVHLLNDGGINYSMLPFHSFATGKDFEIGISIYSANNDIVFVHQLISLDTKAFALVDINTNYFMNNTNVKLFTMLVIKMLKRCEQFRKTIESYATNHVSNKSVLFTYLSELENRVKQLLISINLNK